jgi:hypothetical protein
MEGFVNIGIMEEPRTGTKQDYLVTDTQNAPQKSKHGEYPRPAIRKGLIKITSIDQIDLSNPVAIEKLAAIHDYIFSLPDRNIQGDEHA